VLALNYPPCHEAAGELADADEGEGDETHHVVAPQVEIESTVSKRFIILNLQALKPEALSTRVLILSS
jgi:hypothetical protein